MLPTPTPSPSATATAAPIPTAPPTFAALYSAVGAQLNAFTSSVTAQCPSASYPTKLFTELLPANSNSVINAVSGASPGTVQVMASNAVQYAVALKQRFGIAGVELSINYPILLQNPANFPNASWSTANYATYLSYYEQVVQGLRAAGLGIYVETNLIFPNYVTNPFNYNGITETMLESGVAEEAQHVIDNLKPDVVNLSSEPSTIQYNTGLSAVNDPAGYAAYVSAIRAQVSTANSPATKVGAGVDDWQPASFITGLTGVSGLDFYDYHLYPPDALQAGIAGLQQLRAAGKPVIVTETWLDKEDASVDGTPGPIDSQTVYVRGSYSFWENIDAQYVGSLMQLARCTNVQAVTLWDTDHFYAYVDYSPSSAGYSYAQMLQQVDANMQQAEANGTVTPAGYAVEQQTGLAPMTVKRR
ncbi:MAG: hypothetical protein JO140_03670 [Candidatus Eremiobacteraeota bacterium]|nr:hypothetical protein [Candidatus Eremiobacteraeota bacterium]